MTSEDHRINANGECCGAGWVGQRGNHSTPLGLAGQSGRGWLCLIDRAAQFVPQIGVRIVEVDVLRADDRR
jgi:hypothetical protein